MSKVTNVFSQPNMFWVTPKFVSNGQLVIQTQLPLSPRGWQTVPAIVKDGKLEFLNHNFTGTFNLNPMCKYYEDIWVCQYADGSALGKPKGLLISSNGKIISWLEHPKGSNIVGVNPFWSDGELIGGKLFIREGGQILSKDIVWKSNGKVEGVYESLRPTTSSGIVGRTGGKYIISEQDFSCPGDFASPLARGVRKTYSYGAMFKNGKIATGNTHSWIKNEMTDEVEFLQPEDEILDRFSAQGICDEGRFVWGLAFASDQKAAQEAGVPAQQNVVWDRENGWSSIEKVFGVDILSNIVTEGDLAFGKTSDSIVKIVDWK